MSIPVADPGRRAVAERDTLREVFARVLDAGRFVLGAEHDLFEQELASYLGCAHCVGVASGTDALELALRAIGCRRGDEVVTAANAGFYASTAALAIGMTVRYADVEPATLTLSAATIEPALTPSTRAVVVTHLYGNLAGVAEIVRLCHDRGVRVVEDCAQAAGARRDGRPAGTFGDIAAFSFYPTKNLGALGDGGALATDDEALAATARALRQYAWESKYRVVAPGGRNSRLDELQAAILRTRLPSLDAHNARRRVVARRYDAVLRRHGQRLVARDDEAYVAHLAVALVDDREALRSRLGDAGIGVDVHYPIPDHRQPLWNGLYSDIELPVTEHASEHVLTLPCHPDLEDAEIDQVCEVLDER